MSASKTVADYEDAVRRITRADVDPSSTTRDAILADLRSSNAPQITEEIAREIAESIVSEETVIEAIEAGGELPTDAELDSITTIADDYDLDERQDAVVDEIRNRVATVEDVNNAIATERPTRRADVERAIEGIGKEIRGAETRDVVGEVVTVESVLESGQVDPQRTGRPVFREDVQDATENISLETEISEPESQLSAVADEVSQEVGAPSQTEFQGAKAQAVGGATQYVTAADLGVSDRTSQIGVIRDDSGNALGVVGGGNADDRRGVADEVGADRVFDDVGDLQDSMGLEQGNGEAHVTLEGRRIREVDL